MDSRLRGNDAQPARYLVVIPAKAGIHDLFLPAETKAYCPFLIIRSLTTALPMVKSTMPETR
jgi:hypothetical protein